MSLKCLELYKKSKQIKIRQVFGAGAGKCDQMFKLLVAFVQTNKLGCKDVTCLTVSTGTQGVLRPAEDQLLNDASAERHMTLLSVKTKLTFFFFVQIVF